MTRASDATDPSKNPWVPETDPTTLKLLGKLIEELNECGSAAARCIIQGRGEFEPVTGKMNLVWLLEELTDVTAMIHMLEESGFEVQDEDRLSRKITHMRRWLEHGD